MMRSLLQPGPVSGVRIETLRGACTRMEFRPGAGLTLGEAISRFDVNALHMGCETCSTSWE